MFAVFYGIKRGIISDKFADYKLVTSAVLQISQGELKIVLTEWERLEGHPRPLPVTFQMPCEPDFSKTIMT